MKHEVLLIADQASAGFFEHIPKLLNPCQSQFTFSLSARITANTHTDGVIDVKDALADAYLQKLSLSRHDEDLLVVFRRGNQPKCLR